MISLSNSAMIFEYLATHFLKNGFKITPKIIGNNTLIKSCCKTSPLLSEPESEVMKNPIKRGVIKIPISPEIDALKIAEVTFPFAMETITTEDDTVEGRQAKKKIDSQIL